jgi:hypothetical protein
MSNQEETWAATRAALTSADKDGWQTGIDLVGEYLQVEVPYYDYGSWSEQSSIRHACQCIPLAELAKFLALNGWTLTRKTYPGRVPVPDSCEDTQCGYPTIDCGSRDE